jgi:alpha-methylacyl-CoA racemase
MSALHGVRIIEMEAKGPAPFGLMLMADLGAEIIRIDRVSTQDGRIAPPSVQGRGRRSVALNLKHSAGVELLLELADRADVLVEGYRPGVAERLGFGPDTCCDRNPRLVYARMTGWGQDGPLAQTAAHDINFLALTGALHPIGSADRPPAPPLNLVADYGGGGTYLVIGILAALLERERSGRGQVVDAAMVDGVSSMLTLFHAMRAGGSWTLEREANPVDGGAPWYRCYETSDRRYIAVGALEESFWRRFLLRLGLEPDEWPMLERERWPVQRQQLSQIFARKTSADWEALFEGSDACVTPVLSLDEACNSDQLRARGAFVDVAGTAVPAPAPRLSRTGATIATPGSTPGADTDAVLDEIGVDPSERAKLRSLGAIG